MQCENRHSFFPVSVQLPFSPVTSHAVLISVSFICPYRLSSVSPLRAIAQFCTFLSHVGSLCFLICSYSFLFFHTFLHCVQIVFQRGKGRAVACPSWIFFPFTSVLKSTNLVWSETINRTCVNSRSSDDPLGQSVVLQKTYIYIAVSLKPFPLLWLMILLILQNVGRHFPLYFTCFSKNPGLHLLFCSFCFLLPT